MNSSSVPDRMFGSTPTVYLDQNPRKPSRRHSMLIHDSGSEARLAGEELLKLPCRSYAYLSTGRHYFWDEERCSAFAELVRAAGHSMLDEIHDLRFKRICDMLSCSNLSISEIVFASGYSSQTYPKRFFLARTGFTMRDWRKRHAPARV